MTPLWTPLGAQATNAPGPSGNFSPPFPAYPSGHATFGGVPFNAASRIYLGVHWIFDAEDGISLGNAVARDAFRKFITP